MNSFEDIQCPDLPSFLEKAEVLAMEEKFDEIPLHISDLLSTYRRAAGGERPFAEEFAQRYESGDLPCGSNLEMATRWHWYAAACGSMPSALRLAQHYINQDGFNSDSKAHMLTAKAVHLAIRFNRPSAEQANAAAKAALILLDLKPTEAEVQEIHALCNHKQMINHPDLEAINSKLHRLNATNNPQDISAQVIKSKITEDGDFKAGVYKILESKLPFVGLPNPDHLKTILDDEYPWFGNVTEHVYKQLVMLEQSDKQVFKLRPLLIAGPPGIGKTSYVKRLAELSRTPFRIMMAAGSADNMFLKGTSRGYTSARPSAIAQVIATEFFVNPLFMVDEIDKVTKDSHNGVIWDTLLQLVEPASSKVYLDECLCVPCDFSHVSWIATANQIGKLPKPLINRFKVISVKEPGPQYFGLLLKNLVNDYAKELGVDPRFFPSFDSFDLDALKSCREPREINRLARDIIECKTVDERKMRMRN